ncbi:MAG: hypothetical protein V3S64_07970 [bacterium]
MTISKRKGFLLSGALAIGVVLMGLALTNLPQAEEPVLGPGYRAANLNIEGMT